MFVEDSKTQKGPLQISVSPLITVKNLKIKVEKDFQIPYTVQRWILNDQLASDDTKTLLDFGVKESKSVIYLYIVDILEEKKITPLNNEAKEVNNVENKPNTSFTHFDANILSISDSDDDGSEQNEKVDCDANQEVEESGAIALPAPITKIYGAEKAGWHCPICTLLNPPDRPGCLACSQTRPVDYIVPEEFKDPQDDFPEELKRFLEEDNIETAKIKTREPKNDLNKITTNRKSTDIFNIPFTDFTAKPGTSTSTNVTDNKTNNLVHAVLKAAELKKEKSTLASTTTTLASTSKLPFQIENKIFVATAFTSSPNITKSKYRGVYNFNPTTKTYELPKVTEPRKSPEHAPVIKSAILKNNVNSQLPKVVALQQPKKISAAQTKHRADKRQAPKPPSAAAKTHYLQLLDLDHSGAVKNIESFECPICFMDYEVGQGVILRDCLHTFCRECLANTVQYNEDPVIKCPYMDTEYSCDSVLQVFSYSDGLTCYQTYL
jgi:RanBP-type and C3HC4-type zinc finger-containing protein 1